MIRSRRVIAENFALPVRVTHISHAPGGISGSAEKQVVCFRMDVDARIMAVHKTLELHKEGISDIALRGDDRIFATAGWDGKVRVYNYRKATALAVLKVMAPAPLNPINGFFKFSREQWISGQLGLTPQYQDLSTQRQIDKCLLHRSTIRRRQRLWRSRRPIFLPRRHETDPWPSGQCTETPRDRHQPWRLTDTAKRMPQYNSKAVCQVSTERTACGPAVYSMPLCADRHPVWLCTGTS